MLYNLEYKDNNIQTRIYRQYYEDNNIKGLISVFPVFICSPSINLCSSEVFSSINLCSSGSVQCCSVILYDYIRVFT